MQIQLSDHFSYGKLIRFTMPSILMMLFISVYGIVDGIFISNFAGKTPFAAVNLIMPYAMLFGIIGFMTGAGGSALVAKILGEGYAHRANAAFSLLTYFTAAMGIALAIVGETFLRPVAVAFGAEGEMLEYCVQYGRIVLLGTPVLVLQYFFQPFLIAAQKPDMNLVVTLTAGITNIILDAIFVGVLKKGVTGAAAATVISQAVGGLWPLIFFCRKNNGSLFRLGRFFMMKGVIGQSCLNGSSEFISNVALSVVNMLYNAKLMKMAGENGIAAYGVIMYVAIIFMSVYFGYTMGIGPVISYQYGAQNHSEMRNLLKRSCVILGLCSFVTTVLATGLSRPVAMAFVGYDKELLTFTARAFALYSTSFLISWINIFGSSFFTALNNGVVSAVIAFSRLLVFQTSAVLVLPMILGLDGIWLAMLFAEILSLAVTLPFFFSLRKRYGY